MLKRLLPMICALSLLTLPQSALACLCGSIDAEGAFLTASVVFVGKVVKIDHTKEASVGLLMKESGTLEVLKVPRWEKTDHRARVVTLEVIEPFKGISQKTVQILTAVYDDGATCGVNFRMGESYLVYAYNRRNELSDEQAKLPQEEWTREVRLKKAADKFNRRLPALGTTICARTENMWWAKDDVERILTILKNGSPDNRQTERPKSMGTCW